jgi:hypothetical protein
VQNYQFIDAYKTTKKTFYRIRQVSSDGKSSYSSIAVVNPTITNASSIEYFPNPSQKYVTVQVNKPEQGLLSITLFSIDADCFATTTNEGQDLVSTTLDLQRLNKGTYLMKISIGNSVHEVHKLVKQ